MRNSFFKPNQNNDYFYFYSQCDMHERVDRSDIGLFEERSSFNSFYYASSDPLRESCTDFLFEL